MLAGPSAASSPALRGTGKCREAANLGCQLHKTLTQFRYNWTLLLRISVNLIGSYLICQKW